MARSSNYMDRALRSADPRFARVLGKMGYQRSDMVAAKPAEEVEDDELAEIRAEYRKIVGKKAYHGWSATEIRERMTDAQDED